MAVVTISREFGSEGNYIGTKVAETLGYHFIFKKEIGEVFDQYGFPAFEQMYHAKMGFWTQFDEMRMETMALLTRVIRAFAHHGDVVIVGRCSYAVLAEFTDVLHVRIQAPLSIRVTRIIKENIVAPNEVERFVQEEDLKRVKLLQVFFNFPWDKTSTFDMVIDTRKVASDLAVTWIAEAVKTLEERKEYERPNTKMIEVDPVLSEVISGLLDT